MSLVAPVGAARTPGARETAVGVPSRYRPPAAVGAPLRISPGAPAASVLVQRMSSRHASVQMPPLGTASVDEEAVRLVSDWIRELQAPAVARGR
jgi:hypothetical protein